MTEQQLRDLAQLANAAREQAEQEQKDRDREFTQRRRDAEEMKLMKQWGELWRYDASQALSW